MTETGRQKPRQPERGQTDQNTTRNGQRGAEMIDRRPTGPGKGETPKRARLKIPKGAGPTRKRARAFPKTDRQGRPNPNPRVTSNLRTREGIPGAPHETASEGSPDEGAGSGSGIAAGPKPGRRANRFARALGSEVGTGVEEHNGPRVEGTVGDRAPHPQSARSAPGRPGAASLRRRGRCAPGAPAGRCRRG